MKEASKLIQKHKTSELEHVWLSAHREPPTMTGVCSSLININWDLVSRHTFISRSFAAGLRVQRRPRRRHDIAAHERVVGVLQRKHATAANRSLFH
jgi:hypothetical protein